MKRTFTLLFAAFVAFVGVTKADVTDLPEMSTKDNIKWYAIKNTRSGKYANYAGDATKMTQVTVPSLTSLFYFTAANAETAEGFTPVMIHNAATTNKLEDFTSWTEAGRAWFLSTDAQNTTAAGLHITKSAEVGEWNGQAGWNALNAEGSTAITNYAALDAGSVFVIEKVDFGKMLADYKATAKEELQSLGLIPVLKNAAEEAIVAVEAVELEEEGLNEMREAIEEVNSIVASLFDGKLFTLFTTGRNQYAKMTASGTGAAGEVTSPEYMWQFVRNSDATYYIYNPYVGKYLCSSEVGGPVFAITADKAKAGAYNMSVAQNENGEAKLRFDVNGAFVHLNGSLLPWYSGGASDWDIAEVTDFSSIIESYKAATVAILDGWDTLNVVFDTKKIEAAKIAIGAVDETDWAAIEAVGDALESVANDAAEQYFTFSNAGTDSRKDFYLATNDTVGCGAKDFSYGAAWKLVPTVGGAFYLYNEVKEAYLGAPSSKAWLQNDIDDAAAYTFEIVEAAAGKVELKNGGQTLHLGGDKLLMNYDWNDSASRWIVKKMDLSAEITALLATVKPEDYADVPKLGQYTKTGYEALVGAKTTVSTIAEVEAAVLEFHKSKNLPVFAITSDYSYAAGMSIYEDEAGVLHFKKTNIADKSMLWAFDMKTLEVGVTDRVVVRNVATGKLFWGAESVKVTETSDNENAGIADDGKFLFYTEGGVYPVHAQALDQMVVVWGSYGAESASAWKFMYVGNSYDINGGSHDATDINVVEEQKSAVIYDIHGCRVEKMTKGIYIVNGKKVLVK